MEDLISSFLNYILCISPETHTTLLRVMAIIAAVVFVTLFFVKAGYGMFRTRNWGWSVSNRKGWVLMEAPAFFVMMLIAFYALDQTIDIDAKEISEFPFHWQSLLLFGLFELHYFQRSFIFPYKLKGKSKMPVLILTFGVIFNVLNAYNIGLSLFRFCPDELRVNQVSVFSWLLFPHVIIGVLLFFVGMLINMHSDRVIRHLRHHGESRHYLPTGGFYRWVTSANYFGELVEWLGFAIAAMTPAAWLFVLWTAANLIPRAHQIHKRYRKEFGESMGSRKRIIPFIY